VPVIVTADTVRLQQVVANVLENAVRHSRAGGSIQVRLKTSERQAAITVSDTAEGIPPHALPHIFEPFCRNGDAAGLGIGLNVARRLVELHGRRIRAHSAGVGKGAEFAITLPLTPAHERTRNRCERSRRDDEGE
jgi:signal transduction histidine kinase